MKSLITNLVRGVLGLGLMLSFVNCSKSSDSGSAANNPVTVAGQCGAGYVYSSQYGCLPQGTCSAGYGLYQNQCVIATSTNQTCSAGSLFSTQYNQCLPQGTCSTGYALYNNQCVYVGTSTSATSCQGSCQVGSVQTANGCLPQGACRSCYGYANNGWCYPGITYTNYGY